MPDTFDRNPHLLFPPWLNSGSFDHGGPAAVTFLQQWLTGRFPFAEDSAPLMVNGKYDEKTMIVVRWLQAEKLHLRGDDVDGHLGPATRQAVKRQYEFNFDAIPREPQNGITRYFQPGIDGFTEWPPSRPSVGRFP